VQDEGVYLAFQPEATDASIKQDHTPDAFLSKRITKPDNPVIAVPPIVTSK